MGTWALIVVLLISSTASLEKDCPSNILNKFLPDSSKTKTHYHNGETISVTCPADSDTLTYDYDGLDTKDNSVALNCTDGKWIGHYPYCFKSCSRPDIFAILDPEHDAYAPGDIVTVTKCKKDNSPVEGDTTFTCMADGTWTGSARCPKQHKSCNEQPPTITNAHIAAQVLDKYSHGTVLRYKCGQAYDQTGRHSVTCQDGRWIQDSPSLMSCNIGQCSPIYNQDIDNGRVKNIVGEVGTYAEFECYNGYELEGSARILCMADRRWYPAIPRCNPISCPSPKQPFHGRLTQEAYNSVLNIYQSTIRYDCDKGYRLVGPQFRKCQADRTWSGNDTQCEEIVCEKPSSPENGNVYLTDNSEKVGSQIEYICDEHHTMEPSTSQFAICTENGYWSTPKPRCIKSCMVSPPSNGLLIRSGWRGERISKVTYVPVTTQLIFSCDNRFEIYAGGYIREGRLTCANGVLLPGVPECRPRRCWIEVPANLEYFIGENKVSESFIDNGTLMQARCPNWMELVSSDEYLDIENASVKCNAGALEPRSLGCKNKRCKIPKVENGKFKSGSIEIGTGERIASHSIITLICANGYELYNERTHMYLDLESKDVHCYHGSFNDDIPTCKPKRCKIPKVENGKFKSGSIEIGTGERIASHSIITLICANGYELYNERTHMYLDLESKDVHCYHGSFNDDIPTCKPKRCKIPKVENGKFKSGRIEIGTGERIDSHSIIRVICADGYELYNERTHMYLALEGKDVHCYHGSFDDNIPTCKSKRCKMEKASKLLPEMSIYSENGVSLTVSCPDQMELFHSGNYLNENETMVSCNKGRWIPGLPQCIDKRCIIPTIRNSRVRKGTGMISPGGKIVSGEKAQLECFEGFELHNGTYIDSDWTYITCNAGSFIENRPSCKEKRCQMDRSSNLLPQIRFTESGSSLNVSCPANMELLAYGVSKYGELDGTRESVNKQIASVFCRNGRWTPDLPHCEIVCEKPSSPENGKVYLTNNSLNVGSQIQYSCDEYHTMEPSTSQLAICTANGYWSTPKPRCIKMCKAPNLVGGITAFTFNGTELPSDRFVLHNQIIVTVCSEGYRQQGTLTCNAGNWTGNSSCELEVCDKPNFLYTIVSRAILDKDDREFLHGTKLNATCESSSTLHNDDGKMIQSGTATTECIHGEWKPNFSCKKMCKAPLLTPGITGFMANGRNIKPEELFPHDERIKAVCSEGYSQQGTLTCNTGILKGNSICELEVCHEPSFQYTIVKHDKIENEDIIFSHGTKLNASCESSFTLMTDDDRRGNGKTECIHGEWEPTFSCKKKCTLPAGTFKFFRKMHLNESRKEGDQIPHGRKMVSECESRNKIPLPSTCTNGTWVPLFKACAKDIPRCRVPNDPGMNFTFLHNGTVIEDRHVNAGDMVRVSCKFGYKTFSSPVTESVYEYDNYDVDSTADHAGEPKIMGSEKPKPANDGNYTCDESGNWVPEIRLTCKQISCDSLDDFGFDNGKIIYSTSNIIIEGTVASFTCHSGYRREGQENRTCQEDGTWSGGCVTCQKEKHNVSTTCLAPCVPDGARKTGSHSYEIGSRVEFHCLPSNTQYSGDSSNIRHCIHNGVSASWNGTQINCKGVRDVLLTKIAESFINDWRNLYIALGLRSEEVTVAADEPAMDAPLKILQYWRDNAMRGKPKSIIPQIIIALEQLHKRNEAEALRIVNDLHKVRCMRPLLNGSVKPMKFDYQFGESVTVSSCNPGYMLENQSYLVCLENETWFGNSACRNAICIPECGKNERCVRDNECQCAEGFSGKECDQEIIPEGKCPPLADPHRVIPPDVVNGKRYHKIEIKCNVSQAPFDDISQAVCKEGAWEPWKPYCQNTCILPSVPGTQYKYNISKDTAHPGPISSNRKIKVTCESGYFSRPGRSDVSICDNGYWKPEILACEKIVSCTSPNISDVSIQPSKKWYAVNETILLTGCQKELELVGAKSLSCGTDGSWSGHAQCISYCQNGRTSWNATSYKRASMSIIKAINYLTLPSEERCFDRCKNVARCKAVQLYKINRVRFYCWLLPESTKDMPDGFVYQGLERVYDRVCDDTCLLPNLNGISFHNGGFSMSFTKVQDGTVLSIKCKGPGQTAVPDKVTCMGGQWSHQIETISCKR